MFGFGRNGQDSGGSKFGILTIEVRAFLGCSNVRSLGYKPKFCRFEVQSQCKFCIIFGFVAPFWEGTVKMFICLFDCESNYRKMRDAPTRQTSQMARKIRQK